MKNQPFYFPYYDVNIQSLAVFQRSTGKQLTPYKEWEISMRSAIVKKNSKGENIATFCKTILIYDIQNPTWEKPLASEAPQSIIDETLEKHNASCRQTIKHYVMPDDVENALGIHWRADEEPTTEEKLLL